MIPSLENGKFFRAWDIAVKLMSFFYGNDIVPIAMQNKHRARYPFCGVRHVDPLQIIQERDVDALPVIKSKASVSPLLKLLGRR